MDVLTIRNLHKAYGAKEVLQGIDLSVPENCIFGFIGNNGAGKTTTMKMILGLQKVDDGELYVEKEPVVFGSTHTNRHIGYVSDVPEFYGYMRAYEYMQLCAEISGLPASTAKPRIEKLLELVGLSQAAQTYCKTFSRGMKQRLAIAQALLHAPALLIADEPTSALDPSGRKEILTILQKVKKRTTVLFSTHILSDVENICDEIAILHEGKIVASGNLHELLQTQDSASLYVETMDEKSCMVLAEELKRQNVPVIRIQPCAVQLLDTLASQQKLLAILSHIHIRLEKLERKKPSLEQYFLKVTT